MPENRDSILSLIDIANTLPDVCSSPCIIELQSLIKQSSTGTTFSATSSITSEVLIGNKVSYSRLTATSSETKISDTANEYDTTILTEEEKLKLSLGDESYAGMTYSSIEARTSDGGQTTEIYIKNHDNTYTYDKTITSQSDTTDMSDGTSFGTRYLSKGGFGVAADNGTDMTAFIDGNVNPGSPIEANLIISITDAAYSENYENSISLVNTGATSPYDGRISIYQKDETQPYSAKIEMKADTNTVEIKSEDGTGVTPATNVSNIVLIPTSITSTATDGTNTSSVTTETTNNLILSTDGGDISASVGVDVGGGGSIVLNMIDTTIGSSIIDIQPIGITNTVTDGTFTSSISIQPDSISFVGLPSFDDDADATAGSLVAGNLYQTTGLGASPLDVAGILMIKQ